MYFAIIEAIPLEGSHEGQKYGGANVACWVNEADAMAARNSAIALVNGSGWKVVKIIEERDVFADNYSTENSALEHYEQALTDGIVCVFYTFPRSS